MSNAEQDDIRNVDGILSAVRTILSGGEAKRIIQLQERVRCQREQITRLEKMVAEFSSENLPGDDELISAALTHIIAMERQICRLRECAVLIEDVLARPSVPFKRELEA